MFSSCGEEKEGGKELVQLKLGFRRINAKIVYRKATQGKERRWIYKNI